MTYEQLWEQISVDVIENVDADGGFKYIRDDGFETVSNMRNWIDEDITSKDMQVLEMQSGRVLDLACGFGRHLKYLRGKENIAEIVGVECNKKVAEYNKAQGIEVACSDMKQFVERATRKYDSVLIMGNSIAECGSLETVKKLLEDVYDLLNSGGNIVISYKDFKNTSQQVHLNYQEKNREKGEYAGLVKIRLQYQDFLSDEKQLCYMERPTLNHMLENIGFSKQYEDVEHSWYYTVWKK